METYPYASAPDAAGRELGNPLPATLSNMQRGEVVFGTFCQPCHGYRGVGDGSAVGPGRLPAPPTLHSQKVRAWSDGRIYHNIMMGQNLMPSYAKQIEPVDRWAAILYLRALQRALAPKPGDLPSTGSAPARAAASGQAQPERGTAK
jgi:mono/diheme cytochrome c family protein